jgi:hypothetical protein
VFNGTSNDVPFRARDDVSAWLPSQSGFLRASCLLQGCTVRVVVVVVVVVVARPDV